MPPRPAVLGASDAQGAGRHTARRTDDGSTDRPVPGTALLASAVDMPYKMRQPTPVRDNNSGLIAMTHSTMHMDHVMVIVMHMSYTCSVCC